MSVKGLPFHIQQNTDLRVVLQALALGRAGPIEPGLLASRTGKTEADIRKRIRAALGQLGIVDEWSLGALGTRLANLEDDRPELLGEALHSQLYTLHWRRPDARYSFAYACICDWLCERGQCCLDEETKSLLAGVVPVRAAEHYGLDPAAIAFSKTSVLGATHWLQDAEPPALVDGWFRLRHAVPHHTLLWTIDALYDRREVARGTRISLDEDLERVLSRAALLDPASLYRNLDVATTAYDYRRPGGFFGVGTEGGFGRWVVLTRHLPVGALQPSDQPDGLAT